MQITEQEMKKFAGRFFPGKAMNYASNECIQIQAGEQYGLSLHYEYYAGKVHLHIEQEDWRPLRDYLKANLKSEQLIPSKWGRIDCQWTIHNDIKSEQDLFQAFLDIRSIIEPEIEKFEGKEPQDYKQYKLPQTKDVSPEGENSAVQSLEVNLTNLAQTEQVVVRNANIMEVKNVSRAYLIGNWIGKNGVPVEVCQIQGEAEFLRVQMHIYDDSYCKGVQLLLAQKGTDICGKIEWAKGTKMRAERNANTENIMQEDWNNISEDIFVSVPIGKKGYGIEKMTLEMMSAEDAVKEEKKEQKKETIAERKEENRVVENRKDAEIFNRKSVKCPKCGTESTGKFCPECGELLEKENETKGQEHPAQKQNFDDTKQPLEYSKAIDKCLGNSTKESSYTQIENKHKDVKQVPVISGCWNKSFDGGLDIQFPEHEDLWNMDGFFLKFSLINAIENAARKIKGEDVEKCLSVSKEEVRAIRNLSELTSTANVSKGKMIFSYRVEKFIKRRENGEQRFVGDECEFLKQNQSYPTMYAAPYLEGVPDVEQTVLKLQKEIEEEMAVAVYSDGSYKKIKSKNKQAQIYSYNIEQGSNRPCTECNGEKIERCPKCDGSGRERYVDSYFASGDPKYKTGQCSRCYGKGFITCHHCDGTGLEDKGTGASAIAKLYKESSIYKKYFSYVTPWFSRVYDCSDRFFQRTGWSFDWMDHVYSQLKSIVPNKIALIQKNQKEVAVDKRKEFKENILSKIGYEYGDMYDSLQKEIEGCREQDDGELVCMAQCFSVCNVYKIDYEVKGCGYSICVFVGKGNSAQVEWEHLPKMGVFGKIKN